MRLYVKCKKDSSKKIYLSVYAETPKELIQKIGGYRFDIECPYCGEIHTYSINEVRAEKGPLSAVPAGAIIGGIIGLLGGPLGLLLGGGIGAWMGANADAAEEERVNRFNKEVVKYR